MFLNVVLSGLINNQGKTGLHIMEYIGFIFLWQKLSGIRQALILAVWYRLSTVQVGHI